MSTDLMGIGRVQSLCINGERMREIEFDMDGPVGDIHSGRVRTLSKHDGAFISATSLQKKVDEVFNWRSFTALSKEELAQIEKPLGYSILPGHMLENIIFSGIRDLSKLPAGTFFTFPDREGQQAILAVWAENSPCVVIGSRVESTMELRVWVLSL